MDKKQVFLELLVTLFDLALTVIFIWYMYKGQTSAAVWVLFFLTPSKK